MAGKATIHIHSLNRIKSIINVHWVEIVSLTFLSLLFWITHYYQIKDFGLYEDDITYLPTAFGFTFPELMRHIWNLISHLYGHGRPLHDVFVNLFGWLGYQIHGIQGAYWIGYSFSILNMTLFYVLIRRVSTQRLALLTTLAFCFYTTDSTRIFLTHALGLQPSITLLLVASHLYLSNKKLLAYGVAFLILFAYETPFLVFLGIPILRAKLDKGFAKEMIKHILILSCMLLLVFVIRYLMGEGRVIKLSASDIFWQPLVLVIRGMIANLQNLYTRPIQVIVQMTVPTFSVLLLTFASLTAFLFFMAQHSAIAGPANVEVSDLNQSRKLHASWYLFGAGLVMLVSSYPIALNLYAHVLDGRGSRVHAAAILGASLMIGVILNWMISILHEKYFRYPLILILAAVLAFHAGFGFVVQNEYRLAWKFEKEYWSAILPLLQDAGDNEIILVSELGIPEVTQIQANTWNVPRILNQLYVMPDDWENPPPVFPLLPDWQSTILDEDGNLNLDIQTVNSPTALHGVYSPDSVIFIERDENTAKAVRRLEPILIDGYTIPVLHPRPAVLSKLPKGLLFTLMFPEGDFSFPD